MRLLVIEDDDRVMAALRTVLTRHGFQVTCARTAEAGMAALAEGPDTVLLDLGLPDRDGFQLCRDIRLRSGVPVIMVTARGDLASRVHGLNLGADDYLVKPYNLSELIARIHAVSRRRPLTEAAPQGPAGVIEVAPLRVDVGARSVHVDGRPVTLTRKEFDLLVMLARAPGLVHRREQILSEVWQTSWAGTGRTLEVHVASLRAKLGRPDLIEAVRGVGYRLRPPAQAG
jgi:DNA-binding response OmpR family regulator